MEYMCLDYRTKRKLPSTHLILSKVTGKGNRVCNHHKRKYLLLIRNGRTGLMVYPKGKPKPISPTYIELVFHFTSQFTYNRAVRLRTSNNVSFLLVMSKSIILLVKNKTVLSLSNFISCLFFMV